jgi:hypothetical protein
VDQISNAADWERTLGRIFLSSSVIEASINAMLRHWVDPEEFSKIEHGPLSKRVRRLRGLANDFVFGSDRHVLLANLTRVSMSAMERNVVAHSPALFEGSSAAKFPQAIEGIVTRNRRVTRRLGLDELKAMATLVQQLSRALLQNSAEIRIRGNPASEADQESLATGALIRA